MPPKTGPEVSHETIQQRIDALKGANTIRTRRAILKRDLKAGREKLIDILLDPPEFTSTMKLCDLLLAAPTYGRVKVNKVLAHCRISPSKTIGGLSERQRAEVLARLRR